MSFNSGIGMMYSVPELPTCILSFIASDSTVLAKSGTYRRGMFLGGSVVVISVVSVVGLSLMSLVLLVCSVTMENLK